MDELVLKFNWCDLLMNKRYYYLVICLCLWWGTAQAAGPFGKQLVLPWGVKNVSGLSGVSSSALSGQVSRSVQASLQISGYHGLVTPLNATHVLQTQQELRQLRSQLASLNQSMSAVSAVAPSPVSMAPAADALTSPAHLHPYLTRTFQAGDVSDMVTSRYSGTLFEADGHVFGAVAAHIFGNSEQDLTRLNRNFSATMYRDGQFVTVPARAVFVSPLVDVALVEFNFKDKALLEQPFKLAHNTPFMGQTLSSHGFVGQQEIVDVENRVVVEQTPLAFRTTMPLAQNKRRGLCGSAVVNEQGLLAGMHTGSTRKTNAQEDVGYVVPADVLYKLAHHYQQQDEMKFELDFDGHKIYVGPNEYLAKLTLFDEQGNELWCGRSSDQYFSQKLVKTKIAEFSPRYVEFTIGRAGWENSYSSYLNYEPAVRKVRYSLTDDGSVGPNAD